MIKDRRKGGDTADAFSKTNETDDYIDQPLRFQGQYYDEETGPHYNRCSNVNEQR